MSSPRMCFLSLFLLVSVQGQSPDNSYLRSVLPTDCGTTRFDDNSNARIVGGSKASLGQFPWMVRVGLLRGMMIGFYCGGSLISTRYVITAAHCAKGQGNIVRLGENDVDTYIDCENGVCAPSPQDIYIKKFIVHEKYCHISFVNDYALIQMAKEAKLNDFVRPICFPLVPLPQESLKAEPLTVSGWGLLNSYPRRYPKYLMYLTIYSVNHKRCNSLFPFNLLNSQLCLEHPTGKNACNGDSGGPAVRTVTENGTSRTYQVGLVSYGVAICGNDPDVYTDVSQFSSWTEDRIRENEI